MIKVTLGLKKREKPIPEFEKAKKIIKFIPMKKVKRLKELKAAGKRGSRAGKKLCRIVLQNPRSLV